MLGASRSAAPGPGVFAMLLVCGAVLISSVPAAAQVSVRQVPLPENEFHSPMELEAPLVLKVPLPDQPPPPSLELSDFGKFTCDDVTLQLVAVETGRPKKGQAGIPVKITATIYTRPSYDRTVNLAFTLLRDDKEVGNASIREIDAEEKKTRRKSVSLILPVDPVPAELALRLRVRVEVTSNK